MPIRKIVWVLDQSGSVYSEAQSLLATKDIDLLLFSRDELGPITSATIKISVEQLGIPNLLIVEANYLEEKKLALEVLNSDPEIWFDIPKLEKPTELIDLLVTHFLNVDLKTKIELNKTNNIVEINGQKLKLTSREFEILDHLLIAPEHTVAREDFFNSVWSGLKVCNKVLDVHVSNLRKKVQPYGIKIRFVRPGSFEMVLPENNSNKSPKDGRTNLGPASA